MKMNSEQGSPIGMQGRTVGFLRTVALIVAMGFGLTGCFRQGASTRFYMLQAMAEPDKMVHSGEGPVVGLGPIRIPAYLDRSQIVVAESDQAYRISEGHRWAERLDENMARVSAENLSRMIPTDRILPHPWSNDSRPELQVAINLQELHVDASAELRMTALWSLRQGKSESVSHKFGCRLPASLTDYEFMVKQASQCVARLNREMAEAIRDALPHVGP